MRDTDRMVQQEVYNCVSNLVYEINGEVSDPWHHLFYKFDKELAKDALAELDVACAPDDESAIRMLLDEHEVYPDEYQNEVFEHWIVSEWMAYQLEQQGEVIERDFYGLTVWGRTTTGQAIAMDHVMQEIYHALT